jgi:hypothetical protein
MLLFVEAILLSVSRLRLTSLSHEKLLHAYLFRRKPTRTASTMNRGKTQVRSALSFAAHACLMLRRAGGCPTWTPVAASSASLSVNETSAARQVSNEVETISTDD